MSKYIVIKLYDIRPDQSDADNISFPGKGNNFAIVMQGPIVRKNNFTFCTLATYRKTYPNITIILSTWRGVSEDLISDLNNIDVEVVETDMPIGYGWANINLQIISTMAGLGKIFKDDINGETSFVLKTRTDQRINIKADYLGYMANKVTNTCSTGTLDNSKLVITNLNMFKERLYIVSDMFMFGDLRQMYLYWDVPLQSDSGIMVGKNYLEQNLAEAYFVNQYMNKMGYKPDNTINDSREFICKYFELIDKDVLELFWYKYNHIVDKRKIRTVEGLITKTSTIEYY